MKSYWYLHCICAVGLAVGSTAEAQSADPFGSTAARYDSANPAARWNRFNVDPPPSDNVALRLNAPDSGSLQPADTAVDRPATTPAEPPSIGSGLVPWQSPSAWPLAETSPHHVGRHTEPFGGRAYPSDCPTGECGIDRPEMFPYFVSSDLLFWNLAGGSDTRLLLANEAPQTGLLSSRDVAPDTGLGYDVGFGRYLKQGRYAVSLNYLHFDPDTEFRSLIPAAPGGFTAVPAWEQVGFYDDPNDPDTGPDNFASFKEIFDDMTQYDLRRDVSIQGLELNFWAFGLSGGRRVAPAYGNGVNRNLGQPTVSGLGQALGLGGFGGPLERPTAGTSQLAISQGFRWFRFEDELHFAGRSAETLAFDDQFYNGRTRNDLLGYQIGGRWNYCVNRRINLGIAAKVGVYGNRVEVAQRLGGQLAAAQFLSADTDSRVDADQRDRDTVLAGLGEIDLGIGIRLTDGLTIRGGYRMLSVTGVATTTGSLDDELYSPNLSARSASNESLLLHGAYIGSEFNW